MTALAPTLQAFFTDPTDQPDGASPHTVAAYRDTLAAAARLRRTIDRQPHRPELDIAELDADADQRIPRPACEHRARTTASPPATPDWPRSTRCSRYAALHHPEHAGTIARVLAIPPKRCTRAT